MKLSIRQLLFFAILAPNLLVALGIYAFNSMSFHSGFLDYVNEVEQHRLAPLIQEAADRYAVEGGWDWARGKGRDSEWGQLIRRHLLDYQTDRHDRGRPKPPLPFDPRLLLRDQAKNRVAGHSHSESEAIWKPIKIHDQTVGYLGYRPRERLINRIDAIFAERQQRRFAHAAILLTLISALLAFLLSSRLVKPIHNINQAIRRLARGDYDSRAKPHPSNELGQLARDVNQLAETLQQNLTARQQWIADISHELRTPVAVLQGEIEAMQDGVLKADEKSLSSLHSETLRLSKLVNDLHELTLSDMGALSYQMEPLDLAEQVTACVDSHQSALDKKHIAVQWTPPRQPLQLSGDRQRLTQMLHNLMQNTLRYTDPGGQLQIQLVRERNQIKLLWEDSTPGVEENQLPHLFDRLYRAEASRNRALGGSGLGLSIVRNIVEAHQGQVSASSSDLGGLAISVTLPLNDGAVSS